MEEKILKCPNCGASATNHQNCEYCGSLLVRFVDKGINLSNTSYTSDSEVFPGLIQHLQQNLKMQENTNESVATDIYRQIYTHSDSDYANGWVMSVLRTGKCGWSDGQNIALGEGNQGLCVVFRFETYRNCNWSYKDDFNIDMNEKMTRFGKLDCFPLFTPHTSYSDESLINEYAIDFGKDVEGTARLISDVMQKVFQIPITEEIQIHTKQGDAIEVTRNQVAEERNPSMSKSEKWMYIVGGISLIITFFFKQCT